MFLASEHCAMFGSAVALDGVLGPMCFKIKAHIVANCEPFLLGSEIVASF